MLLSDTRECQCTPSCALVAIMVPAGTPADARPSDAVATLRHLAAQGIPANTLKALVSDIGYLEAWCEAVTRAPLPWPASESLVLQYIAHHLYDAAERARNPAHGMPEAVAAELRIRGVLQSTGPHAPKTVKRRLGSWAALHRWRKIPSPFRYPEVSAVLRLAIKAANRPRVRMSAKAITMDILEKLLATCWQSNLIDIRDRAMLLTGFCSGGRRRSEIVGLTVAQIADEPDIQDEDGAPPVRCVALTLGRTKTESASDGARVFLTGYAAEELRFWLAAAKIEDGPVFRPVGRWGHLGKTAMTAENLNRMIKKRCERAGLDPHDFSAHGLRSGYLTQACREKVPLIEAMQQTRHKSMQEAAQYYNEVNAAASMAARIVPPRPKAAQ